MDSTNAPPATGQVVLPGPRELDAAAAISSADRSGGARNGLRSIGRSGCNARLPNARLDRIGDAIELAAVAVRAPRMDRDTVARVPRARRRRKREEPVPRQGRQTRPLASSILHLKALRRAPANGALQRFPHRSR